MVAMADCKLGYILKEVLQYRGTHTLTSVMLYMTLQLMDKMNEYTPFPSCEHDVCTCMSVIKIYYRVNTSLELELKK